MRMYLQWCILFLDFGKGLFNTNVIYINSHRKRVSPCGIHTSSHICLMCVYVLTLYTAPCGDTQTAETCATNVGKGWCTSKNEKMEEECYKSCGLCSELQTSTPVVTTLTVLILAFAYLLTSNKMSHSCCFSGLSVLSSAFTCCVVSCCIKWIVPACCASSIPFLLVFSTYLSKLIHISSFIYHESFVLYISCNSI